MPKQIITLSSSQITLFKHCPRKFYYSYVENLRSPYTKQKAADRGTLVHLMLQMYYTLRVSQPNVDKVVHSTLVVEMFKQLWNTELRKKYDFSKEEIEFITTRFTQYVFQYYTRDFIPSRTKSGLPGVEIGFSKVLYEDQNVIFIVEGRLDFLGSMSGIELWGDHKTQGESRVLYQYRPQFLTYSWGTGLDRALINYIGMQTNFEKKQGQVFHRQLIYFPKWRIDSWANEMLDTFWDVRRMLNESKAVSDIRNCGPIIRSPEEAFPVVSSSCGGSRDYFPCFFTQLCETQDQRIKESIKTNYFVKTKQYHSWEPEEGEVA